MDKVSKKTTRRYWRRTATPRPWWPWGLAPLAGLGALFLIGALLIAPRIEAEVRDQVSHRIDAAGLPAMDVRSDGQGITVNTLVQAEQVPYVHALAGSTRCDTWAGQLACPTTVDVRRIESQAAPAVSESRPHRFAAERIDDGVLLTGEVPNLEEHDRILGVAGQQFENKGGFSVRPILDRKQCNTDFDQILGGSSIRFQTGSASIDKGNDDLLQKLAELAKSCPGTLNVQGHTDSQGDADNNQVLSLARATAVRDALVSRGIEAERVTAAGYGESRPIADNGTAAGRAKNRRIAITIDELN